MNSPEAISLVVEADGARVGTSYPAAEGDLWAVMDNYGRGGFCGVGEHRDIYRLHARVRDGIVTLEPRVEAPPRTPKFFMVYLSAGGAIGPRHNERSAAEEYAQEQALKKGCRAWVLEAHDSVTCEPAFTWERAS